MKVLIVIAHCDPNKDSQSHKLANAAAESLREDGNEVQVVDLVEAGFDKVATVDDFKGPMPEDRKFSYLHVGKCVGPDVKKAQDQIAWATHIIAIGPMWWFRYPACFDAWQERCFTVGFAFTHTESGENGPLKGKKALCIMTTGAGDDYYTKKGLGTIESFLLPATQAFRYTGMTTLRSVGVYGLSAEQLENEFIPKFKLAIKKLDQRPALPSHEAPVDGHCLSEVLATMDDFTLDDAIKQ